MKTTETPTPSRRRSPIFWVPTAYFGMGLPFVVLNMVAVLMYKGLGVSDAKIAFWTSLIMLPWTLKPLWSPLLEMYRTKKFFVVLTQMVSGVTFGLIALSLHLPSFFAITIALFAIVAFSGATHDVACDGVYMDELNAQEQAKYIGWQGAFYNVAKIIGTGLLVYLAGFLKDEYEGPAEDAVLYSWTVIMIVFGGVMFALGLYHTRMLPSGKHAHSVTSFSQSMAELWNVIRNFFTKKHILYYICFIILYRLAEGFIMKIAPLFLRASRDVGGLGLSLTEIGTLNGIFGSAAFVLGSLLAGIYVSKFGLKKTLFTLCCIFNLPFVAYTFLAVAQPTNVYLIGTCITMEYFGYGFGFVGLTLFMMQQIAPGKHQMSHYAFASGIMNLGVMLPGMVSGYLSDLLGYRNFFIYVLIATIPAFLITYFIPFTYDDSKNK
mgnify:CR=1 FL=1